MQNTISILKRVSLQLVTVVFLVELILILLVLDAFSIKYIVTDNYFSPLYLNQGGQNIFTFNTDILAGRLGKENPKIKNIIISKHAPDTLKISYKIRTPFMLVTDRNNEKIFISDREGVVFDASTGKYNYPLLITERISIKEGIKLMGKREIAAIEVIDSILNTNIELKKLVIAENTLTATADQTEIVFNADSKAVEKIDSLQLLLNRYTIESNIPQKIDLRYDKPVVTN